VPLARQERTIGCTPAEFSGEDTSLANMTMVRLEADQDNQDRLACRNEAGEYALAIPVEDARAKYARKAVMVMRGGCTFEDKWRTLQELGVGAMIVVDAKPGHFPIPMELGTSGPNAKYNRWDVEPNGVGIPVCMTYHEMWERFAPLSNVAVNFRFIRKYRFSDERVPDNDITGPPLSKLCFCSACAL